MERHAFSDAIGCATDRACDVSAMAVAVVGAVAIIDSRVSIAVGAPAKLCVRRADASVDNVNVNSRSRGRVVVLTIQRTITLVNSIKSPGRVVLGCVQR